MARGLKKMNINRFTGTNVTLVTRFEDVCRRTGMTDDLTNQIPKLQWIQQN